MHTENKEYTGMGKVQRYRGVGTDYRSGHLNSMLSIHVTFGRWFGYSSKARQDITT